VGHSWPDSSEVAGRRPQLSPACLSYLDGVLVTFISTVAGPGEIAAASPPKSVASATGLAGLESKLSRHRQRRSVADITLEKVSHIFPIIYSN
jgi:hypothetical protein